MNSTWLIVLAVIGGLAVLAMIVFVVAHFLSPVRTRPQPSKPAEPPPTTPSPVSLSVQRVDKSTKFTVNGVTYQNLDDIPDPEVRARARLMFEQLPVPEFLPTYTLRTERATDRPCFVVDGVTYERLDQIPNQLLRKPLGDFVVSLPAEAHPARVILETVPPNAQPVIDRAASPGLEHIADPELRRKVEEALQGKDDGISLHIERTPLSAEVSLGGTTKEASNPLARQTADWLAKNQVDLTRSDSLSVTTIDGQISIVVNGKTYERVEDIPDPHLRAIAARFLKK